MAKSFSEIPLINVSRMDAAYWDGGLPSVMARLAVEHGPIFRWVSSAGEDMGQMRVTMIGPEANRFVMNTHRQHFSHDMGWSPFVGEVFGRGLLNMDDPEHAVHRKMWNPAFAASYMDAYLPVMQRVIEERTSSWVERGEVDLYSESRQITFDIAAAALAGFETGPQMDELRRLFAVLLHGFDDDAGISFEEMMGQFYSARDRVVMMLLPMIHARRSAPPEERPHDVLSLIVHARDDNGHALSDEQVLGHLSILLVAGHETTTTLATWALYLLSTMPEQHARLLQELEAASNGSPGPLSIDKLRSLRAMDNFVRETGRLYPPVINVPRGVAQDVEFEGYTIPAGAQVRLALAGCQRLPSVFKDPDTFDPDRFASPREEDKQTPYSLVTFGGGPRVCIGQHFANIEVKALLAHVLPRYTLTPIANQHPVHAGFLNAFIPGGIKVQVTT
ncbi:MAG: cytochrome P450 [Chloroflexota bacterium]